jgi:hypothetical protein
MVPRRRAKRRKLTAEPAPRHIAGGAFEILCERPRSEELRGRPDRYFPEDLLAETRLRHGPKQLTVLSIIPPSVGARTEARLNGEDGQGRHLLDALAGAVCAADPVV